MSDLATVLSILGTHPYVELVILAVLVSIVWGIVQDKKQRKRLYGSFFQCRSGTTLDHKLAEALEFHGAFQTEGVGGTRIHLEWLHVPWITPEPKNRKRVLRMTLEDPKTGLLGEYRQFTDGIDDPPDVLGRNLADEFKRGPNGTLCFREEE